MTYDAADKYVVLFGGWNGSFLADTWSFNGFWTPLTPTTSPSARSQAAFTFDYKDGYGLLFGGLGAGGRLNDTWKFVHGSWTHLTPLHPPIPLSNASLVWDANDSYAVLFGGSYSSTNVSGFTWSFVGGAWTLRAPPTSPPARENEQLGYDNTNGWVVLFGGETSGGGTVFADTWNFTRGHWTQLHPVKSPGAVFAGAFTNDSADGYLLLFGGRNILNHNQGSTWSFVNGVWTQQTPATPASARSFASAGYLGTTKRVVLFGGLHTAYLNDTWTYHANVWAHVSTNGPPTRAAAAMTYDEADGYVLLFGGATGLTLSVGLGDTWTYSHGHWSQLRPANPPAARIGASMTYDAGDGYVLLFGGEIVLKKSFPSVNDTWTFLAGRWTQLHPTLAPNPRVLAGLTYDAADGYVLLFGGEGFGGNATVPTTLNDTWLFQAGVWTEWAPPACTTCGHAPSGREGGALAYDPWDGYVVLYGGENLTSPLVGSFIVVADTWTFLAGTWTNITATAGTPPPARAGSAILYDALDGYLLLYGGTTTSGTPLSDTWSFVGGSWTQLSPAHSPGADYLASAAFDATDGTVLYLSGVSLTGGTWLY
jgi:hypothetical protein